jgi:hypothetical protein
MGYRQTTLKRVTQNDKLARFRIRGRHDRFQGYETIIFLNDEVTSSGVDDSHTGCKGRRNPPKRQFDSTLAWKRNYNQEPS